MYIHDTSYKGVVLNKILFDGFLSSYAVIKNPSTTVSSLNSFLLDAPSDTT